MSHKIIDNSEDDSLLINPEELKVKRIQRIVDNEENEKQAFEKTKSEFGKIYNKGGQVAINFETQGRFDMPSILYFKDFTIAHVNDLTLSREEDILENIVVILQQLKNEDANVNIEDMLPEEFLEVLVGLKMEFNNPNHKHFWLCECQSGLDKELQKINETNIDLRELKYKSISELDIEIKEFFRTTFCSMSSEDFNNFMQKKYNKNDIFQKTNESIEEELKSIKIKEPINLIDEVGNIYSFKFLRIKDILNAQKLAENKYANKFHIIKNKKHDLSNISNSKIQKEKEIEQLKYQQAKDIVLFSRAFTLVKYNDKELTTDESLKYYKAAPRSILLRLSNFLDKLNFGICDERSLVCPHCGETSRRLLRQEFDPYELLPLDTNSDRESGKSTKLNVYFTI